MATFRVPDLKTWTVVCGCESARQTKVPVGIEPEETECNDCAMPQMRLGVPLRLIKGGKER